MYEYEFYFPPRLTLDEVNELLDIEGWNYVYPY